MLTSIAHRWPGRADLPVEGHLPSFEGATGWLNSRAADAGGLRGKRRPRRLLDVHLHQLAADAAVRPRLGREVPRPGADGRRRPHARVRLRARRRQHRRAVARPAASTYPIAIDSDYGVWRAFANHYWPAIYLADAQGRIRYHHFGEGEYAMTEMAIQQLLLDAGATDVDQGLVSVDPQRPRGGGRLGTLRSPETYLGYGQATGFASPDGLLRGPAARLRRADAAAPQLLGAERDRGRSPTARLCSAEPGGRIAFRFQARDVNLVMGPAQRGHGHPVPRPPGRPAGHRRARIRRRRRRQRHGHRAAHVPAHPPAGPDRRAHLRDRVPRGRRRGVLLHVRLSRDQMGS